MFAGMPKGAILTHGAIVSNISAITKQNVSSFCKHMPLVAEYTVGGCVCVYSRGCAHFISSTGTHDGKSCPSELNILSIQQTHTI